MWHVLPDMDRRVKVSDNLDFWLALVKPAGSQLNKGPVGSWGEDEGFVDCSTL
jgi:hypothetical protein